MLPPSRALLCGLLLCAGCDSAPSRSSGQSALPHVTAAPVFPVYADAFEGSGLATLDGTLLRVPDGHLEELVPGRWLWRAAGEQSLRWFDTRGQELAAMTEVFDVRPLSTPQRDDVPVPLRRWIIGRDGETALVDADGQLRSPWLAEGDWHATEHDARFAWEHRHTDRERIFDEFGDERFSVSGSRNVRFAGPFAGRPVYLICESARGGDCQLRSEDGKRLFRVQAQALLPMDEGQWLVRQGDGWWVLNAAGEPQGDQAYVQGMHLSEYNSPARGAAPSGWPKWVQAQQPGKKVDDGRHGLLTRDGRFVAVRGHSARLVCVDRWALTLPDGEGVLLVDGAGRERATVPVDRLLPLTDTRLLGIGDGPSQKQSLLDCDGQVLFNAEPGDRLREMGGGISVTAANVWVARAWVGPEGAVHAPEGTGGVRDASPGGTLLVVYEGEHLRLYNTAEQALAGPAFGGVDSLKDDFLVFNEDGWLGLMDAHGEVVLPARFFGLRWWGDDRLWSSEYTAQEDVLQLHDLSRGEVLMTFRQGSVLPGSVSQGSGGWSAEAAHEVMPLLRGTVLRGNDELLPQWWVDREGRVLLRALRCPASEPDPRAPGLRDGALFSAESDTPLYLRGECAWPESLAGPQQGDL